MSMYKAIIESASQFEFEPEIVNKENLFQANKFVVTGMGGSHLAADLIKMWKPEMELIVHKDYGLPKFSQEEYKKRLFIFSSYSGNTEEVIDAYTKAGEMGLNRAVITIGGKLLEMAMNDNVAYIQMPDTGIQPRSALGLSLVSFLKIMGLEDILSEVKKLSHDFHPEYFEEEAKNLAEELNGRIPVIYTSTENMILGYIFKINFNETGKIPAFNNVFPELNHNEINGFDVKEATVNLYKNFCFIFITDEGDHPQIKKRMEITAKLYIDRNIPVKIIKHDSGNNILKVFNSIALAELGAYFVATNYGLEAEQVPMIEELKKML